MATAIEERQLRVFCPIHRINFEVVQAARILCESGGHVLAHSFPHESFWEYCCDCQVFWPSEIDKGGRATESCPVCTRETRRRYVCDSCKLMSIESNDPARRKSFRITTRGAVEPSCPSCLNTTEATLREHVCEDIAATFWTAHTKCPFCDEPIKRMEPVVTAEEKIFCGNCGTQAVPDHSYCKNCGWPVGASAPQMSGYPMPSDGPPQFGLPPLLDHSTAPLSPAPAIGVEPLNTLTAPIPAKKGSSSAIVAGVILLVLLGLFAVGSLVKNNSSGNGGGVTSSESSRFKERLDRALAADQFFAPTGSSVADLYEAELARSPNSQALKEAATRIKTRLDPIGDSAIQNYYTESDSTIDWSYIAQVYELLKKVAPDNSEYSARYAYSLGLVNLKNKNYQSAVYNFQEALRHRPDWVLAYNGLGRVYVQDEWSGRDYSKTIEYYRKACDLDTNFTWGCRNLGAYYMKVENWPYAEEYMGKALQRSPGRDTIWKAMGKICSKVGKTQDTSTGFCYSY